MRNRYTLFKRKNQKLWYFYYYEGNNRKSKSTGETTKIRAKKYVEEFFIYNKYNKNITLNEYTKTFFVWDKCLWIKAQLARGKSISTTSAAEKRGHLKNHILPAFGEYFLHEITKREVQKWLLNLNLANKTKNHIVYTMRIIFREAENDRIIQHNILDKIDTFVKITKKRDCFTIDELKELFSRDRDKLLSIWKTPKYAAAFAVFATTGIRTGELRALRWKHFINNYAFYIEQAVKADEVIGKTKNEEERIVILPKYTIELLNWWYDESPFIEPDDIIFFVSHPSKPANKKLFRDLLSKCLKRANFNTAGRNIVVHSFRHTYNTLMRNVLTGEILRQLTGHKSIQMTDHYDHPTIEDRLERLKGSIKLIDSVWE